MRTTVLWSYIYNKARPNSRQSSSNHAVINAIHYSARLGLYAI